MAILKKIRSATLVETLVSSVIIVLIFMITSVSVNNVLRNVITHNTFAIQNKVKEITYLLKNQKINIPYSEETQNFYLLLDKKNNIFELNILSKYDKHKNPITLILGYELK
jgi:hypothetical protein